jgi:hypothetical protein
MRNLIDAKLLLQAFVKTEQLGLPVQTAFGTGFQLNGLQVANGYDGYELFFQAAGVTVTLGFHQKYFIDAANEQQVDQFVQLLQQIARLPDKQ